MNEVVTSRYVLLFMLRFREVCVLSVLLIYRSNAFGKEHGLTSKAKALLQAVDV